MTEYYDLLSATVADQLHLSQGGRLQLYDHVRKAMIDRLDAISPPLSRPEIENETGRFDRAVIRVEREITDRGLALPPPGRDLSVGVGAPPLRNLAPKRRRSRRRATGANVRDGVTAFGVLAIAALCVVRATHPLPGNLLIRIRWDQLLASPLRAEGAPRRATDVPGDGAAIGTGAAPHGTMLARLATAAPPSESYHDVDLSRLPQAVRNLLRAGEKRLKDYRLRDVFAEFALVEAPHGVLLVKEGSNLENVGRVTSIQQREQSWVVMTTAGVIVN